MLTQKSDWILKVESEKELFDITLHKFRYNLRENLL